MSGPYRGISAREVLTAPTRDGRARLEIGPEAATLELDSRWRVTVAGGYLSLERLGRRRRRSWKLEARRLVPARAFPGGGLGLWLEEKPRMMRRLAGFRPVEILAPEGLEGVRALERLGSRLRVAIRGHARGALRGEELGQGQHRVLLLDDGSCHRLYARPLFREHPRLSLEVHDDGTVVTYRRGRRFRRAHCRSRYDVLVGGDFIRFVDRRGDDRAALPLPWISAADRDEIAARVAERVDRNGAHPP